MNQSEEPIILSFIKNGKSIYHHISGWRNAINIMLSWSGIDYGVCINTREDIIDWTEDMSAEEIAEKNLQEAISLAMKADGALCYINNFGDGWKLMDAESTARELAAVVADNHQILFLTEEDIYERKRIADEIVLPRRKGEPN